MATPQPSEVGRRESPDPASHATNIYDASNNETASEDDDENDIDDMDFEPTTDESEDAEFFDPTEDVEADFHGMASGIESSRLLGQPVNDKNALTSVCQMRRMA